MRKLIVLVVVVLAVGGGAYVWFFKRSAIDSVRGYGDAKTPQECVDRFNKAIKDRNYEMAAKFCTAKYAEQIIRGKEASEKLGAAITDLRSRLEQSNVLASEIDVILFCTDPLPPEMVLKLTGTPSDTRAAATFEFAKPSLKSAPAASYQVSKAPFVTYYWDYVTLATGSTQPVAIVKEGDGDKASWKLDFVYNDGLTRRVGLLNDKYKDFTRNFEKFSQEIRQDPDTKSKAIQRFSELYNDAATVGK